MTKGRTLADGTVKGRRLTKRKYNTIEQKAPVESDNDKIKTFVLLILQKRELSLVPNPPLINSNEAWQHLA